MKNIKKLLIVLLVCLLPFPACLGEGLQWRHDGSVSHGQRVIQTQLQSIYEALAVNDGIFLAGYKIDKVGVNYPYIAFVDQKLEEPRYWAQSADPKQFFEFDHRVHLLDVEGTLFFFEKEEWRQAAFSLKPDSIVVHSSNFLVACRPAPLMMTDTELGCCYSPQKQWQVEVNWRSIKPAVCDGVLTVVEERGPKRIAHRIDLKSGKIVKSKQLTAPVEDACRAF